MSLYPTRSDLLEATIDVDPHFRNVAEELRKWGDDVWCDPKKNEELILSLMRAAYGAGVCAAIKDPNLLHDIERLGYRFPS